MSESLKKSIVRFYQEQRVVGAGFQVQPGRLLTCAHVVAFALGQRQAGAEMPASPLTLDFPHVAPGTLLQATVAVWQPQQDIAGLTLAGQPPAGAQAALLAPAAAVWDHPFRAFGFPAGHEFGVWADGRLKDSNARGWLQIEDDHVTGFRLQPGFSGSPVWDETLQAVVGMAVAASTDPSLKVAYVWPSQALAAAWPEVVSLPAATGPPPAGNEREAAVALHRQLRQVLLDCAPFYDPRGLRRVFADPRLRAWRRRLPEAGDEVGRMEAVVDLLDEAFNSAGENGLVLLLRVLSDNLAAEGDDACAGRLAQVAAALAAQKRRPQGGLA